MAISSDSRLNSGAQRQAGNAVNAADPLLGKVIHDTYVVTKKLGEGAMGRVYLAENVNLRDIRYAIKVLKREFTSKPRFRQEFYDEAKRQAQLRHPNIVQVHDYFIVGEDFFLVLAFVDGQSLSDRIDTRHGPMDEKEALAIIKEVLKALNCAHQNGVIHLDVKSSNIMIDKECARLTDFGIAREAVGAQRAGGRGWVGTPEYMSPEQYLAPDRIDHRSDVYSAGIVLFEMMTGTLPFAGATADEILQQHVQRTPPDPCALNRRLSKPLARIIGKAIEKDPAYRYQGCLDFLKAIENYERRRHQRKWLVIALPLAAGVAAAIYALVVPPADIRTVATAASNSFAFVCRDANRRSPKAKALAIATESGDRDVAQEITRQLEEMDANIAQFTANYISAVEKLARHDQERVRQALDLQARGPETRRYAEFVAQDLDAFRTQGQHPNRESMLRHCGP